MRRAVLAALLIALLLSGAPIRAQDIPLLSYNQPTGGRLSNAVPRAVYAFDALRGEIISIGLRVIEGDLLPVLAVVDSAGAPIAASE
ncbi:MAG: hypothetical protein CUN53_15025, partial [Phototrophicales bacterium]